MIHINTQEWAIRSVLDRLHPVPYVTDVHCAAPDCWYVSVEGGLTLAQSDQLWIIGYSCYLTPIPYLYHISKRIDYVE